MNRDAGLILALDQGGSSTRAATYDSAGNLVNLTRVPIATHRQADGRVEHDPAEMIMSLHTVIGEAQRDAKARDRSIAAAGLATQRSSIVCWDRLTGKALSPVISWQDCRAADLLERHAPDAATLSRITGLVCSPHYGASKLRWCLENIEEVARAREQGNLMLGPMSSFLLFHLLEGQPGYADPANASRTLLLDVHKLDWSEELLAAFGIPRQLLPDCVSNSYDFGNIRKLGIPLVVCTGDQNAAIFARGDIAEGLACINIGTGAFVLARAATVSAAPLLQSVAWSDGETVIRVQEGTVNGAGAALHAFGANEAETVAASALIGQTGVPLFLNGVSGLGSPYWRSDFASRFIGDGTRAERITAILESIVFLLQVNLELLAGRTGVRAILVSGGLSAHDGLCQALADLAGLAVIRPLEAEATARGLAFLTAGFPVSWDPGGEHRYSPRDNPVLRQRHAAWQEAMQNALAARGEC